MKREVRGKTGRQTSSGRGMTEIKRDGILWDWKEKMEGREERKWDTKVSGLERGSKRERDRMIDRRRGVTETEGEAG